MGLYGRAPHPPAHKLPKTHPPTRPLQVPSPVPQTRNRLGKGVATTTVVSKGTTSNISKWCSAALTGFCVNAAGFSGVCCRMGGLTAIEARVPEHILCCQSGHAQDRAARSYLRLQDPDKLYDTWRAFNL